jgi:Mor family transcriptional regulator
MYVLYFALYVFVCGCLSCIFKFFNLGITYKKIPKKYVGKKTPIYNIVRSDKNDRFCNVTKYELLFTDNDSWLSLIIPFHINCSKLGYVETFSTNSIVELFKNNGKELVKKSYEELVSDCEDQLRKYKDKQIIEYREKKSLQELNKTFTENYLG